MSDHALTRRAFGRGTIDSVLTFCLLEHLCLHDAFGKTGWSGSLEHVMKDLIALRERQRSAT